MYNKESPFEMLFCEEFKKIHFQGSQMIFNKNPPLCDVNCTIFQ
jgi:hypothetical protein